MRSKSEVIIAETLNRLKIPFRYEAPLVLKNASGKNCVFHPDFTCLKVRTREEVIWEHFGIMDDADYAKNAVQKMALYVANHFDVGRKFIPTFETMNSPLSMKFARIMVRVLQ